MGYLLEEMRSGAIWTHMNGQTLSYIPNCKLALSCNWSLCVVIKLDSKGYGGRVFPEDCQGGKVVLTFAELKCYLKRSNMKITFEN